MPIHKTTRGALIAAFATVYIVWGSTYLGIRIAVESIPPFLLGAARFLSAGALLYVVVRLRGAARPTLAHWLNALASGFLLLGVGNGGVNWAEQRITSGIAALMVAGTPLWFALLEWARPHGTRPTLQTSLGLLTGFAGVAMLVTARGGLSGHRLDPFGVAALMLASFCWAAGSLYARYTPKPEQPLMGIALQMLAGGGSLLILSICFRELRDFHIGQVTPRSALAFAYLTVFGSLIAFSAYGWLLKATTPARLSTYAYVNPVIAVFLGWLALGEPITAQMLTAATVILAGVIIITRQSAPKVAERSTSRPEPNKRRLQAVRG